MKTMSLALLALVSFASYSSFAGTDPDNTKIKITSVADAEKDCKLSLKEIKAFDGKSVGKRYLCAQLVDFNNEITLTDFARLAYQKQITIQYAGTSTDSLIETLNAWKAALITTADDYSDPKTYLTQVAPWSFKVIEQNAEIATLAIVSETSGTAVNFTVLMNQKKKEKQPK